MDSGNSGSMQSSSGGDEEYDSISRPESVQSFLNPSSHFNPMSNQHPSLLGHNQPSFFNHSSNYLQALSQSQPNSSNPNSLLNLGSRGLRSDPNCTDLGNLQGSSSSSQPILASQGLSQNPLSSMQLRSVHDNGARSSPQSDQTNIVKNPKKRTRASRRAPTTVLTTDTSNFRQMVQEFTGIPAPPFSGSSYSRRLDLFGSGLRSGHLEPMGPLYSLHPSAQKVHVQPPSFVSSAPSHSLLNNNSVVDATNIASATNNNSNSITTSIAVATTNTFNSTSSNYQLASDLGLPKQPHNVLNMQPNQMLSFQSFLQPPPPFNPSLNVPGFGAKSQVSLTIPSLEELGMSQSHGHGHGHVSANLCGLPSHAGGVGSNDGRQQDHLRPFDGNFDNSQRVNNSCKLNFSASSSDFHHDKGLENVASRGEGTVDSWICPSD